MSRESTTQITHPRAPDARVYLRALRRSALLVVAAVLLAGTSAHYLSERVLPRTYESSALLIIIPSEASSDSVRVHPGLSGFVPDQSISETYRQLGDSIPVASAASADLAVSISQLRSQVSTRAVQKTPLLRLSARADDPRESSRLAQGYASAFVRTAERLDWVPGAKIALASPAAGAGAQVSPRTLLNTTVAVVVALLLAVTAVAAAARFGRLGHATTTLRSRERAAAACRKAAQSKRTERAA